MAELRAKRRFVYGMLVAIGAAVLGAGIGGHPAQPPMEPLEVTPHLHPVITDSRRDGLLLGLDFRLSWREWAIEVGGAYGLDSRAVRFTSGLRYHEALELSYGDWPQSPVQGREGEEGGHVAVDLISLYRLLGGRDAGVLGQILQKSRLRGSGFVGTLWPDSREEESPSVRYAHLDGFVHWPLPWGVVLETRGELLYGRPTPERQRSFQTFYSSTRLRVGTTSFAFRMGSLENPAGLAGFRFDLGLRSYPRSFQGERFFLATLERQYELLSTHLFRLDLAALLGPELGGIPVWLNALASVFFEGGIVFDREAQAGGILFGWGVSLLLPDLETRIDLGVSREGGPVLSLETGVRP